MAMSGWRATYSCRLVVPHFAAPITIRLGSTFPPSRGPLVGDIRTLKDLFNESWDWSTSGEEWSSWWGGTPALWYGALLPRIHSFVPTGTILEIAPGFGRWTQYLKDLADRLILVDLAEKCIEHCSTRFADAKNMEFHVNDGRSLPMVADASVDLVFSWDSLVHADMDIIDDYVGELRRILTPNGVAFLHHSNVKMHARTPPPAITPPGKRRTRAAGRGQAGAGADQPGCPARRLCLARPLRQPCCCRERVPARRSDRSL